MKIQTNMKKHRRRGSILTAVCAIITTVWMLGTIAKDYGSSYTPDHRCPTCNSPTVPDAVIPGAENCTTPWLHKQIQ